MVTVIIGNSLCRVAGLTETHFKKLRTLMSYSPDPQARFFSGGRAPALRYLLGKKGDFPTGLLYILEDYLGTQKLPVTWKDTRKRPEARNEEIALRLHLTPYPEQRNAVAASIGANRGIISASTGVGKSLICAMLVDALKVNTLIVVPSLELKRQLTASFRTWFGERLVGGKGATIAIENVDALDPKVPLKGYDCVIIDEFHHSGAKTYRHLNRYAWEGVYYKFGLTATPFRSSDHERLLLESVLSQVIYRIDYPTAVKQGYIVPVEAYYVELPKRKLKNEHTWAEVYSTLITRNLERNQIIAGLLKELSSRPTLCLVKEIDHGDRISTLSEGIWTSDKPIAFVKGENLDNREMILEFCLGHRNQLIGTTGVLGEGVDTKPCEYVIIAGLGKSKNAFMQQVGRGVRVHGDKESCKVIIFKDPSHKFTLSHFKAQCKILKEEYGVTPTELKVWQTSLS